jgi:hypothetical protein
VCSRSSSRTFFPDLIAGPFHQGLITVFTAAAAMALIGALISSLRGSQFYYGEQPATQHLDTHLENDARLAMPEGQERGEGAPGLFQDPQGPITDRERVGDG